MYTPMCKPEFEPENFDIVSEDIAIKLLKTAVLFKKSYINCMI